ncbi:hypothetical protein AeMF1_017984 [Aphanomyces euteiches]|nr:hypothetical protein AeMF1_017984 [Aphanomyces euteiches]KAH9186703.1 hypothetical protein AeNC1_011324 [Aphanomyces euteiches]
MAAKKAWWTNPVFHQVILGTYDDGSPFARLRGCSHILEMIFHRLLDAWRSHLDTDMVGYVKLEWVRRILRTRSPRNDAAGPRLIEFPPPNEIDGDPQPFHVNMMPFILGDERSLPESCRRYQPIILQCIRCLGYNEEGKVNYLTIHEGWVEPDRSQRREGLHVEASGGDGFVDQNIEVHWGGGYLVQNHLYGGIFMASTVAHSCGVWNVYVEDSRGIRGPFGDIEHLRSVLDEDTHGYRELEANELIWITDATPHESLPVKERTFRQFFRLVTNNVTYWYADHSTANPLGIQPDAEIIHGDKFGSTVATDPSVAPQRCASSS